MGSVNLVFLVGYLGRDAEVRYTATGAPIASVSLATSEVWTDKSGQRQERVTWHHVVIFGKTAEALAEYLTKGKQIFVQGRIQVRSYEKDGSKRTVTEVRGDRVVLLGSGPRRQDHGSAHVADEDVGTAADPALQSQFEDDIPF